MGTGSIPSITRSGDMIVLRDLKEIKAFSKHGKQIWSYARRKMMSKPYPPIVSSNGKIVVYRHFKETVILMVLVAKFLQLLIMLAISGVSTGALRACLKMGLSLL